MLMTDGYKLKHAGLYPVSWTPEAGLHVQGLKWTRLAPKEVRATADGQLAMPKKGTKIACPKLESAIGEAGSPLEITFSAETAQSWKLELKPNDYVTVSDHHYRPVGVMPLVVYPGCEILGIHAAPGNNLSRLVVVTDTSTACVEVLSKGQFEASEPLGEINVTLNEYVVYKGKQHLRMCLYLSEFSVKSLRLSDDLVHYDKSANKRFVVFDNVDRAKIKDDDLNKYTGGFLVSYFTARKFKDQFKGIKHASDDAQDRIVFFGLQYMIKKHLTGKVVTLEKVRDAADFVRRYTAEVGLPGEEGYDDSVFPHGDWRAIACGCHDGRSKSDRSSDLDLPHGHLPIKIEALDEGTLCPPNVCQFKITNTHPRYFWLPNYLETLLVQVWYATTVATQAREFKLRIQAYSCLCGRKVNMPESLASYRHWAKLTEDELASVESKQELDPREPKTATLVRALAKAQRQASAAPQATDLSELVIADEHADALSGHVNESSYVLWKDAYWMPSKSEVAQQAKESQFTFTPESVEADKAPIHKEQIFDLLDFGYRGVSTAETARVGCLAYGTAGYQGSDTMDGWNAASEYYDGFNKEFGLSHTATTLAAMEHSNVTSWVESTSEADVQQDKEYKSFINMLKLNADKGGLGMVIDGYNAWGSIIYHAPNSKATGTTTDDMLGRLNEADPESFLFMLNERIKSKKHTLFRPDSGEPIEVLPQMLTLMSDSRVLGMYWEPPTTKDSSTIGLKDNGLFGRWRGGAVRILQGDGVKLGSVEDMLASLVANRFCVSTVNFGSGGGLLQKVNRDSLSCAFKACALFVVDDREVHLGNIKDHYSTFQAGGVRERTIEKRPITAAGKKSSPGSPTVIRDPQTNQLMAGPCVSLEQFVGLDEGDGTDELRVVFYNGKIKITHQWKDVLGRCKTTKPHLEAEIANAIANIDAKASVFQKAVHPNAIAARLAEAACGVKWHDIARPIDLEMTALETRFAATLLKPTIVSNAAKAGAWIKEGAPTPRTTDNMLKSIAKLCLDQPADEDDKVDELFKLLDKIGQANPKGVEYAALKTELAGFLQKHKYTLLTK
jgi:nicotinic acid phosphoribosyltransferase